MALFIAVVVARVIVEANTPLNCLEERLEVS